MNGLTQAAEIACNQAGRQPGAADPQGLVAMRAEGRLPYIDNIRWSMIVLVLSMHASDTYSPFGNWYYTDRAPLSLGERLFFATYQSFLQGFFMALLFFIAAYFVPASYDRKGSARYLRDRFVRLMLPTLLYVFAIGPVTEYYISRTWTGGGGFADQWLGHVRDGEWASGTGPMWFCAVLFGFSLIYALIRLAKERLRRPPLAAPPVPSLLVTFGFILAMALATFAMRACTPNGRSILNIHPGDLPQYALMFAAGILAGRGKWLERLLPNSAVVAAVSLAASGAIWMLIVILALSSPGDIVKFSGGLNPLSALRSLWEALVCVGMSYLLLALYRRYLNTQGRAALFLSRNAFAVYLFHPPILIGCAIFLHDVSLPGPWKAALLTLLAACVTFSLSSLVFRRIPYVREVL